MSDSLNVHETVPRVGTVFMYDKPAPAEWTQRLREISPVSDALGYLELVWEPGDPWLPVERYLLYEMVPLDATDEIEYREMHGPHPRATGHICTDIPTHEWYVKPPKNYQPCLCRHKSQAWKGGPNLMTTLTQWKLFRTTGLIGRPFWVIQGKHGGHKIDFTHQESQLLEREGYPPEPPPPGELPFAPFDERVVKAITRFNRLWQFKNRIEEYKAAMGSGYDRYRAGIDKELRKQLVDHLKEQMADVAEDFIRAADLGEMDNQPRTEIDFERLDEQSDEEYVETGNILHHSRMR